MKRILSIALSLVMAVTFIPVLGINAYAEDELQPEVGEEMLDSTEEAIPETQSDEQTEESAENINEETIQEQDKENIVKSETEAVQEQSGSIQLMAEEETPIVQEENLNSFSAKMNRGSKTMHIEANFKQVMFKVGVFVDGSDDPIKMYDSVKSITDNIRMANYSSCREHNITLLYIYDSHASRYSYADRKVRISIYEKPSAKGGVEVYYNRIVYQAPVDPKLVNYRLYLDYSINGKTWKRYGPMSAVQTYTIKGLKANKKYRLRIYYGYGSYTGRDTGSYKYIGTYRTGMKAKPAVKSIKVKAYNVKKKKQKVYGAYTGLYLGKRTYYKYKIKITVKLKRKPGTRGIWINGKKFKGNKKTYTVKLGTFTSYSKPKGKKYKVAIYSYHNGSWGGYSPVYVKNIKIK